MKSGNPVCYYNGTRWDMEWSDGRRLALASNENSTIFYTYDLNGIRTSKTVNGVKHEYTYASGRLLRETYGNVVLDFAYDASGNPFSLTYKAGSASAVTYYYVTNLQGDVMYLVNSSGTRVASYTYDPYGKVDTATGSMAAINPLRYRGYYYDTETGFYYLQSRYYDPLICRFINADEYASTGQGLVGYNMFAYCGNNPTMYYDESGNIWGLSGIANAFAGWLAIGSANSWNPVGVVILAAVTIAVVAVVTYTVIENANAQKESSRSAGTSNLKAPNLPSWKKLKLNLDHILSGHTPNGSRNPKGKKTVFWGLTTQEIVKAIHEAYMNGKKIQTQGDSVLVRGFSATYNLIIDIWVNLVNMTIETAFPK